MKTFALIVLLTLPLAANAYTECTDYPTGDRYCVTTGPTSVSHVWTTPTGKQYVWGKVCWVSHGAQRCVSW